MPICYEWWLSFYRPVSVKGILGNLQKQLLGQKNLERGGKIEKRLVKNKLLP